MFKGNSTIVVSAICMLLIAGSCTTTSHRPTSQNTAYDNCMKERIKDFPDLNASDAKLAAHLVCNMQTGYMDEHYFECLPIAKKMFIADGISDANASAAAVCKYYAQACAESPQHPSCQKNRLTEAFQRDPNIPYPGSQLKKVQYGSTLLIDLVSYGDVGTLEAVIKRGANVNESMGGNWTPLAEARSKGNQAMVDMLLRYGAK